MVPHVTRFLLPLSALALLALPAAAQRPALTGEKAQVAEAVKADLTRLSELQTAHHNRTRVYAADARDLGFTPTSGATINIAYASMNAWAANASHPVLSPVACFIIISSAEPTGPAAQPFCQEGRPGSGTVASGQPAAGGGAAPAPQPAPQPAPAQPAQQQPSPQPAAQPSQQPARATPQPAQPQPQQTPARTGGAPGGAPQPAGGGVPAVAPPSVTTTPTQPSREPAPRPEASQPAAAPRPETGMTPAQPAPPLRQPSAAQQPAGGPQRQAPVQPVGPLSDIPASARAGTRDIDPAGMTIPTQTESVTAQQFSARLNEFAQGAATMYAELQARNESIVRDPYESTAEFEARRAAAFEATQRREREFFQQNSKTYTVAMPVREVRYDPDREIFEFTVDGVGLPITRAAGSDAPGRLSFTCYTRPVFWCSTEAGMTYEAGDMWKIPRGTARQFDILRTPLTLNARFAVGRRNDAPVLAISLLSMDLQARGQSVSRWDGSAR
jgi:hypothetical protein